MRPQMYWYKLSLPCFCVECIWLLPGIHVSSSLRPLFDSASCNISSSEWHVGCDIDHVIMDIDMKINNK